MALINTKNQFQMSEFKNIYHLYDAFIIDLWGVVHNGIEPYKGVIDCLQQLKSDNKSVLFLTNAPRPAAFIVQKLNDMGIQVTSDELLTSGDVVREQLIQFSDPVFSKLGRKFFHLGENRNPDILAGILAQSISTVDAASFVLLTAYINEGEDLNQYDKFLQDIAIRNLPVICANPDKVILNGTKLRYCSGFIAEKYEKIGGIVHYYGKPYKAIYAKAFERLKENNIQDKKRILMIGDTLETDILGAKTVGIDSVLVKMGNAKILLEKNVQLNMSELEVLSNLFKQQGIEPNWVIPGFRLNP